MYSEVEKKFDDAAAKGALKFTPGVQETARLDSGVPVVYTKVEALTDKPAAAPAGEKKPSPWTDIDEDLLVKRLDEHSVVLNKFPVTKNHVLLVTNDEIPQTIPLSEDDWAAAVEVLRALNSESGRQHVGFFNSGAKSGASIDHKHIQFVVLPEGFHPFPDSTKEKHDKQVYTDDRLPFAHFIRSVPHDADVDDFVFRYSQILGEVLTKTFKDNYESTNKDVHYNLVFTEDWILGVPRTSATAADGTNLNALATIGMFLAKSDEELENVKAKNFALVTEAGHPYEQLEWHAPDFSGYTLY